MIGTFSSCLLYTRETAYCNREVTPNAAPWQTAFRSGGAVNETPVSVSLPLGLAHGQTHNALLWNGYLCLDTSVFDSTRAMF